jgi:hypothetical protein
LEIGGGAVRLLIGIRSTQLAPILKFTLPSGLCLYESKFRDVYGATLCFGGPHEVFTESYKRAGFDVTNGTVQVLLNEVASAYLMAPRTVVTDQPAHAEGGAVASVEGEVANSIAEVGQSQEGQMQSLVNETTGEPEEPSSAPEEPSSVPDEPSSAPEEPSSVPDEPSSAPEEPSSVPDEPSSAPVEPSPAPEEPSSAPDDLSSAPDELEEPSLAPQEPVQGELVLPVADGLTTDESEEPSSALQESVHEELVPPVVTVDSTTSRDSHVSCGAELANPIPPQIEAAEDVAEAGSAQEEPKPSAPPIETHDEVPLQEGLGVCSAGPPLLWMERNERGGISDLQKQIQRLEGALMRAAVNNNNELKAVKAKFKSEAAELRRRIYDQEDMIEELWQLVAKAGKGPPKAHAMSQTAPEDMNATPATTEANAKDSHCMVKVSVGTQSDDSAPRPAKGRNLRRQRNRKNRAAWRRAEAAVKLAAAAGDPSKVPEGTVPGPVQNLAEQRNIPLEVGQVEGGPSDTPECDHPAPKGQKSRRRKRTKALVTEQNGIDDSNLANPAKPEHSALTPEVGQGSVESPKATAAGAGPVRCTDPGGGKQLARQPAERRDVTLAVDEVNGEAGSV